MMTDAHDRLTFELDMDGDSLREECGVFGVFGHEDASALTALGMPCNTVARRPAVLSRSTANDFTPNAGSGW